MKRFTLSGLTGLILALCMLALLVSGVFAMNLLQDSNLELLYSNTEQLVSNALRQTEERIEAARQTAYDIIVSDTTQNAVSGYWDAYDAGDGRAALNVWQDRITNSVSSYLQNNSDVLCANYIDPDGNIKVVASKSYMKLTDSQAEYLCPIAIEARGDTLLLRGDEVQMNGNILIVMKQLREKRQLSMRHSGVVVLFLDINKIGSALTEAWDGMFVLKGSGIELVFGEGPESNLRAEIPFSGYRLREYDGTQYFVTGLKCRLFDSGAAALPYNPIFATTKELLTRHTVIFALCCAVIFSLALTLFFFATRDFAKLRRHFASVSSGIEGFTAKAHSRDAHELFEAFNGMAERINRLIRDNYQAELEVKDAQLAALQAQINPHFLYNTLNSIYWAAKSGENEQAATMTQDLSRLLRDAVNTDESIVSVDRELEITINYIRIQKQRYRERLNVEFDIDSEVSSLAIPKFTIQPLLENAIKYGTEHSLEGGHIEIKMTRQGDRCVCLVENEGPAPEPGLTERIREGNVKGKGTGVGLVNIDRRIRAMFGDDCGVSVERDEAAGRTVIKLEFAAVSIEKMQETKI